MERYDLMGDTKADNENVGILRTASPTDEKNDCCTDAAITPSNLHNVLGSRKANTSYSVGNVVACPCHAGLMLKCTQAGTTSTGSLDTASATLGKVYTDGGVKWEVINPLNGYFPLTGGNVNGNVNINANYAMLTLNEKQSGNSCRIFKNASASVDLGLTLVDRSGESETSLVIRNSAELLKDKVVIERSGIKYKIYGEHNPDVPVGASIMYSGNTVPDGYLAENGAEVSRTTYAKLFAAIGTKYGAGNGSTTFNLPNRNNGSFPEGSDTAGIVKSAGLPNITGQHRAFDNKNASELTGAFAQGAYGGGGYGTYGDPLYDYVINFDASRCSSVYGNSDTVQPKAVTVKFCIKY